MRLAHAVVLVLLVTLLSGCTLPTPRTTATDGGDADGTTSPTATAQPTSPPPPRPATWRRPADLQGSPEAPCDLPESVSVTHGRTLVLVRTAEGCMLAELFDDKTPLTVANFRAYVEEGFYRDVHCYRIIAGFVNQCGGGADGKSGSRPPIRNEAATSGLRNTKYTLAMARSDAADSATTEFYVNAADNCFLDHPTVSACPERVVSPHGYAVFGTLVAGQDVSDRLNRRAGESVPLANVEIQHAS